MPASFDLVAPVRWRVRRIGGRTRIAGPPASRRGGGGECRARRRFHVQAWKPVRCRLV